MAPRRHLIRTRLTAAVLLTQREPIRAKSPGEGRRIKMSITQLLQHDNEGNVFVTVSISDLRDFANDIVERIAALNLQDATGTVEADSNELMTADEVCQYLGVTKPTLHRWDKLDYLKKVHVGRCIRYRRADVMSFSAK